MPFNFKEYEAQCSRMTASELVQQLERQRETITSAGTGTAFALIAAPITMGLSAVALGGTGAAYLNARTKRKIAKKYLALAPPESSTQAQDRTSGSRVRVRGAQAVSRKRAEDEDDLPAYTPAESTESAREKQTYVPVEEVEMDAPPSYDTITVNRVSTSGASSTHSLEASVEFMRPGSRREEASIERIENDEVNISRAKGKATLSPVVAREEGVVA